MILLGAIPITDNDSLAARVSVEIGADLAIMMSDIDGVYTMPPNSKNEDNRILHTFIPSDLEMVKFGEKSNVGTGGMESKVYLTFPRNLLYLINLYK